MREDLPANWLIRLRLAVVAVVRRACAGDDCTWQDGRYVVEEFN